MGISKLDWEELENRKEKTKTPTQNPSTATTTRRVPGGVGGVGGGWWWYNCEFSVIPLPTRARTGKGWPTQASTRARALLGIDNFNMNL